MFQITFPSSSFFHSVPHSAKGALPTPVPVPGNPVQFSNAVSSIKYEAFLDEIETKKKNKF